MNKRITTSSISNSIVIELSQRPDEKYVVTVFGGADTKIVQSLNGGCRIKVDIGDDASVLSSNVWDTRELAMTDFHRTESRLCKIIH